MLDLGILFCEMSSCSADANRSGTIPADQWVRHSESQADVTPLQRFKSLFY